MNSYPWQVGDTPINMNTAVITEPMSWTPLALQQAFQRSIIRAWSWDKTYQGKAVPKSMLKMDFVWYVDLEEIWREDKGKSSLVGIGSRVYVFSYLKAEQREDHSLVRELKRLWAFMFECGKTERRKDGKTERRLQESFLLLLRHR